MRPLWRHRPALYSSCFVRWRAASDAVLGSPPYLSRLTAEQHAQLREIAAQVWCPRHYAQLNSARSMLAAVRVGVQHMGTVRDRLKLAAEASPGTVAGRKLEELSKA